MTELTRSERKYLRAQAHHLAPVVIVGKGGVTASLIGAVDDALEAHELIKVRFNEFKKEKKALAAEIAEQTNSVICGVIGHVLILYRQQDDPEKRRIELPKA